MEKVSFIDRGGRGSHRNFEHPGGAGVMISGQEGDDAKPYQERAVRQAIDESELEDDGGEEAES